MSSSLKTQSRVYWDNGGELLESSSGLWSLAFNLAGDMGTWGQSEMPHIIQRAIFPNGPQIDGDGDGKSGDINVRSERLLDR